MYKDEMTEWAYGAGAVKTMAKFMLMDIGKDKPGPVICGGVFDPLLDESRWPKNKDGHRVKDGRPYAVDELWVAELIIIPKFKFNNPSIEGFIGLTINQKICSDWSNASKWTQIFP